ncbi:hypothetical protein ACR777_15075 [Sphingobacterium spiritivorum]|uniref:hypothetical protein n=1 Tax=Sphingobacterium spiritivorum TaxID=258 RepID=UPI003DA699D4
MESNDVFNYLEQKASQHILINHNPENDNKAFYVIEDSYDLDELDQALRNFASFPAMLTESYSGRLEDNESANYTDSLSIIFMIVDKRADDERVRDVRDRCLRIGKDILIKIRKDRNSFLISPNKYVDFNINSNYSPIGPMLNSYYGYQFGIEIIIPTSF